MKQLLLTTALALISSAGVANGQTPSNVIIFGDSSADLGTFGPDTRPTNLGEMWGERFARLIGLTSESARLITPAPDGSYDVQPLGGNNYAINGSTALSFEGVFTLRDQVDFFIEDNRRFEADDLVFVWITRNDITTAAALGLDYDPQAYADAFVSEIDRMRALGARNIVSFGAETQLISRQYALDLGVSPEALDALQQATIASEAALWPLLAARDVYILDLDRLAEDVRANPGKYGFQFTTDSYQGRGDPAPLPSQAYPNDGNVFTLDGHYTSTMQAVVADFALAQLRARDQYASVFSAIGGDFSVGHANAASNAATGRRLHEGRAGGWRLFAGPSFEAARLDSAGGLDPRFEDSGYALLLGADGMAADDLLLGVQFAVDQRDGSFAGNTGDVERTSALLSVYASAGLTESFSLEAVASVGVVGVDRFERRATLGDTAQERASGDTEGSFLAARIGGRYGVQMGEWGFDLGAGLSLERTKLNGFQEQPGVLALTYGDAELDAIRGDVGATLRHGGPEARLSPHVSVGYQFDFSDDELSLDVGPNAETLATYWTERPNLEGASIEVGATYRHESGGRLIGRLFLNETADGDEATGLQIAFTRSF